MVLLYHWVFSGFLFMTSYAVQENCTKYRPYLLVDPATCCRGMNFHDDILLMNCGLIGTMVDGWMRPKREEKESIIFLGGRTEDDIVKEKKQECYKWACLYDKMGFLDGNTRIDREALERYLVQYFKEDYWEPAIEHAITECVWTNRRITLKYEPCKPKRISACIGGIVFQHCPKARFEDTISCNMLKRYLWECVLIRSLH